MHDLVQLSQSLADVLDLFKAHGISQLPVLDGDELAGILTEQDVLQHLVEGHTTRETSIAELMVRSVSTVSMHSSSSELPGIFAREEVAIVVDDDQRVVAVLTKLDLIEILAGGRVSPEGAS